MYNYIVYVICILYIILRIYDLVGKLLMFKRRLGSRGTSHGMGMTPKDGKNSPGEIPTEPADQQNMPRCTPIKSWVHQLWVVAHSFWLLFDCPEFTHLGFEPDWICPKNAI